MKLKIILFFVLLCLPVVIVAQKENEFLKRAKGAEIVVIAEVVERYSSDGFWSGTIASTQKIKYKVITVLKGKLDVEEFIAGHYVVHNSYTADGENPQLSRKLFQTGNKLILLLSTEDDSVCTRRTVFLESPDKISLTIPTYCSASENFGVRPYSESLIEKIKRTINN